MCTPPVFKALALSGPCGDFGFHLSRGMSDGTAAQPRPHPWFTQMKDRVAGLGACQVAEAGGHWSIPGCCSAGPCSREGEGR